MLNIPRKSRSSLISITATWLFTLIFYSAIAEGANLPPKNPYLADSHYAVGHVNSAQQDSLPMSGPREKSRALLDTEIDYAAVGPAHFGASTSGLYTNGKRVFWSNGLDRIGKVDHDTFKVLATYYFPGEKRYNPEQAKDAIARFNDNNSGFFAIFNAYNEAQKLRDLSSVYTLLDINNTYFIGSKNGTITAYGDQDPKDPGSTIIKLRKFSLPREVTGLTVGMNMTYDGWLVVATEHGYLITIKRDFSDYRVIRIKHSEGAEDKASGPTGYGWIRNGFAIDKDGGIYIASQRHMHKVIWTGDKLSTRETEGAWSAEYLNAWGHGTGATPSLMGFGEEDQFVVITDGEHLMNVLLFWRNEIPKQWRQLSDSPSRRIAGMLPANMAGENTQDNPPLTAIQSEQSVVVAGYGALVVNNVPRNIPWYLPQRASALLISFLGSNPHYQPFGVQKFSWNPKQRRLQHAWVNKEVSSPNCVPIVSHGSNTVYLVGARNNQWTLEAIDWSSGHSVFHYITGEQRYNSLFAGTLMDEEGRIHYGTSWGRVRLNPK